MSATSFHPQPEVVNCHAVVYQTLLKLTFLSCLWTLYTVTNTAEWDSLTKRFSDTATFMRWNYQYHYKNQIRTSITSTRHTFARHLAGFVDEMKLNTPVQARVLVSVLDSATGALLKLQNLFRKQKGSMKSRINAGIYIACFTYCQVKEKFLCAPASVQNWQLKFLPTVTKRPDSWLYNSAFRKIKDHGSAITSSMEEAEWGWAVQRQSPVGRSVRPSWYRAPPGAHDHVLNTAVFVWIPLWRVSICLLPQITRTYTLLLRI